MKELNFVGKETVYDGFLKFENVKIALPNGKEIIRERVVKPDVIAVLAVTKDGEVFLTKQPRAGVNNLYSIEIPAGKMEYGEDPEESATRELSEETGCVLTQKLISLGKFVGDPACCTSITYLFLALNVEKRHEMHLDVDEYLESFKLPIDEVYSMFETGEIMDANSIIALERARKYFS